MRKIEPRPLPLEVASRFLEQVVGGDYPPGSMLPPENDLAQSFDVSRIVVREAMRILGTKGVVQVRQGRNTMVSPLEDWNHLDPQILRALFQAKKLGKLTQELVEMRTILEVEAAGLAAQRATDEDIAALSSLLLAMRAEPTRGKEYLTLENQFHMRVWQTSRNVFLVQMLSNFNEVFEAVKQICLEATLPDWDEDHVHLVEAIVRHDPVAARRAMKSDITRFEQQFTLLLKNGPDPMVKMRNLASSR